MNDRDDEDLLALYRRSRDEQPSELVDWRIRNAALSANKRRHRNWLWALSKVAVVVLSFSVVLQLWLDSQVPEEIVIFSEESTQGLPMVLPQRSMEFPLPETPRENSAADLNIMQKSTLEETTAAAEASGSVQSSAPTIDRFAVSPEPAASMSADEAPTVSSPPVLPEYVPTASVSLPELPTSIAGLASLDPQLTVRTDPAGNIDVISGNQRVLSVSEEQQLFRFRAWRGSELLGVLVDWDLQADQLSNCNVDNDYLACPISASVTGFFTDQVLQYIEWSQPRSSR